MPLAKREDPPGGERGFTGFPARCQAVAVPSLFFSAVLPQIQDVAELRVCLHVFWLLGQIRSYPRFVTLTQLQADSTVGTGLRGVDVVAALNKAVARGTLLRLAVEQDRASHELYFINDEPSRRAADRIARGELSLSLSEGHSAAPVALPPPAAAGAASIFDLYEQNIGLLTPLLAEELAQAEKTYPAGWIEDAFREAVQLNKRNWRYIVRILERWAAEGKGNGEARRHPEAGQSPRTSGPRRRHPLWG